MQWLKHNTQPYEEVKKKWHLTYLARKKETEKTSILEYFQTFRALMTPTGYLLVLENIFIVII